MLVFQMRNVDKTSTVLKHILLQELRMKYLRMFY